MPEPAVIATTTWSGVRPGASRRDAVAHGEHDRHGIPSVIVATPGADTEDAERVLAARRARWWGSARRRPRVRAAIRRRWGL
jgi:hypothetical protein